MQFRETMYDSDAVLHLFDVAIQATTGQANAFVSQNDHLVARPVISEQIEPLLPNFDIAQPVSAVTQLHICDGLVMCRRRPPKNLGHGWARNDARGLCIISHDANQTNGPGGEKRNLKSHVEA